MKQRNTRIVCFVLVVLMMLSVIPTMVSADETATVTITDEIVMTTGASIRITEDYGIRFEATVSKTFLDAHPSAVYGMIIAPTSKITGEFTDTAMADGDYVKADSEKWAVENADGSKAFRVALTGLNVEDATQKANAANMSFSARAYAKDGDNVYWSAYDSTNNARSISDVALLAKQSKQAYAKNEIISGIASLAKTDLAFSYIDSANLSDDKRIATITKTAFQFYDNSSATQSDLKNKADLHLQGSTVKSNVKIAVGQKVTFDYNLLLTNDEMMNIGTDSSLLFYLTNGGANIDADSVYSTMLIWFFKTANAGYYWCGAGLSENKDCAPLITGDDGNRMGWDRTKYRFTIEVLQSDTVNGGKPYAYYTLRQLSDSGDEERNALTKIAYFEKDCDEVYLAFSTYRTPYSISNLKVEDASIFTHIDRSNVINDAVTTTKDSFSYGDAFTTLASESYLNESIVRTNIPLSVGQKITFKYTWTKSHDTILWNGTEFWLASATRDSGYWDLWKSDSAYTATTIVYNNYKAGQNSCDAARLLLGQSATTSTFSNSIGIAFTGNALATNGAKMSWDQKVYNITIEIREGTGDNAGKALFRYYIAEEGGKTYTADHQTTLDTSTLADMSLFFATFHTAYTVSNLSVSAIS